MYIESDYGLVDLGWEELSPILYFCMNVLRHGLNVLGERNGNVCRQTRLCPGCEVCTVLLYCAVQCSRSPTFSW